MVFRKLVEAALIVVLIVAAVGQLPRLNHMLRVAQIQLAIVQVGPCYAATPDGLNGLGSPLRPSAQYRH
jgi:hypothetical protein